MMRDYHPLTGRYIESDPIGLLGGINTFVYAGNSPLNWVDPLGLIWAKYDGGTRTITIFSNDMDFLGKYPAMNETIRSSLGQISSGIYDFGTPRGPLGISNPSTGNWFIPIQGVPGRTNIGLHGGGRSPSVKNPFAPRQGWVPTRGCLRVQNEDLEDIVRFIQQDIVKGNRNRIVIIPEYPIGVTSQLIGTTSFPAIRDHHFHNVILYVSG